MESGQNLRSGFIRVKFDVIANPVCRKKSVDAARLQQFTADNFPQQLLRVGKEFARFLAVFLVLENLRINAAQFPNVKERRPVNEFDQIAKRDSFKSPHTREFRLWQIVVVQLRRVGAGLFDGEQFYPLAGVLGADVVVFITDLSGKLRLPVRVDEIADDRHGAAGIQDVDDRLAVAGRNLHRSVSLLVVAPPMSSGRRSPSRSISRATCAISSSDGVMSPLNPMMSG